MVDRPLTELLTLHYDPVYLQSMQRNFTGFEAAVFLCPADHSAQAMSELARTLIKDPNPAPLGASG